MALNSSRFGKNAMQLVAEEKGPASMADESSESLAVALAKVKQETRSTRKILMDLTDDQQDEIKKITTGDLAEVISKIDLLRDFNRGEIDDFQSKLNLLNNFELSPLLSSTAKPDFFVGFDPGQFVCNPEIDKLANQVRDICDSVNDSLSSFKGATAFKFDRTPLAELSMLDRPEPYLPLPRIAHDPVAENTAKAADTIAALPPLLEKLNAGVTALFNFNESVARAEATHRQSDAAKSEARHTVTLRLGIITIVGMVFFGILSAVAPIVYDQYRLHLSSSVAPSSEAHQVQELAARLNKLETENKRLTLAQGETTKGRNKRKKRPSYITTEDGEPITTESGSKLIQE